MFRRKLILIFLISFIIFSSLIFADPDVPTYNDYVGIYPEMSIVEAEGYLEFLIEEGDDFYLIEINGQCWLVHK